MTASFETAPVHRRVVPIERPPPLLVKPRKGIQHDTTRITTWRCAKLQKTKTNRQLTKLETVMLFLRFHDRGDRIRCNKHMAADV